MVQKNIEVNGKKFIVRELLAIEADEILDMNLTKTSERLRERLKKQCDLTDEDYKTLTERQRDSILKVMNTLNGWNEDFQKTQETEEISTETN